MQTIAFQQELCPDLPNIYGAKDYVTYRSTLIKIDEILTKSGLEHELVLQALTWNAENNNLLQEKFYNLGTANYYYRIFKHALRCNIARHLTGESYRSFSVRLTDSVLFQWFTSLNGLGYRKATSKSSLERYEKYFNQDLVSKKIRQWLGSLSDQEHAQKSGLSQPVEYKHVFMDSTCIKSHIHFPVDWVLLRDAARSLLSAIKTIRAQGLKQRMIAPSLLLKQMNNLCIRMTHTRRKKDSKKQRKAILRLMKKVVQCIARHSERYRDRLQESQHETDWSEAQVAQVINRIDNILEQLPNAIKQAHDRIIGGRLTPSADKILSLYDKDAHIIVRGKAGNEVEFGQGLLIAEQKDGVIIDWSLQADRIVSDTKLLQPALVRIINNYGDVESACTDRGFDSKENKKFLEDNNIENGICPKSPKEFQEKKIDPSFMLLQSRRSQTEARIGIFKNVFLGKPLRSRITQHKRHVINWCVLTHNLWVLARRTLVDDLLALQAT